MATQYLLPTRRLLPHRLRPEDVEQCSTLEHCILAIPLGDAAAFRRFFEKSPEFGCLVKTRSKMLTLLNPLQAEAHVFAFDGKSEISVAVNTVRQKISAAQVAELARLCGADAVVCPFESLRPEISKKKARRATQAAVFFGENVAVENPRKKITGFPAGLEKNEHTKAFLEKIVEISDGIYFEDFRDVERLAGLEISAPEFSLVLKCDMLEDVVEAMWLVGSGNFKNFPIIFDTAAPFLLANQGKLIHAEETSDQIISGISVLDLKEPKYFEDFDRVMEISGCEKFPLVRESLRHSRAYLHHLLMREELLGYQALTIGNFFVFDRLVAAFSRAREADEAAAFVRGLDATRRSPRAKKPRVL